MIVPRLMVIPGMSWTSQLFIEYGALFLKVLQRRDARTREEADTLVRIFASMHVKNGGRILDVCCGYGRHAIQLAEKGYQVAGIDLSPFLIERAKTIAKTRQVSTINYQVGDVRNILQLLEADLGTFDAAISMYTSIGYYDEATDRSVFRQLNQLVNEHGLLIVETMNRDFIVKYFQPYGVVDLDDCQLHEHRRFNYERSRMESTWKFYQKDGETLQHLASTCINHRVYSLHELIVLLNEAGWEYVNAYGTLDLAEPVTPDRGGMLVVSIRA